MQTITRYILILLTIVTLGSCYNSRESRTPDAWNLTERELDSISFTTTHHYTRDYNFIVKSDSLILYVQQPEELITSLNTDSVMLRHGDHIVVADIRMMPADLEDSVWVQVARDQSTIGWLHESSLLPNVVPDDPISQFIDTFSNTHLIIFLIVFIVIAAAYTIRRLRRKGARIVHFNDIPSFYPTLLTITVSVSATFYASIQLFVPEAWRHFYYHPTLNPFSVPLLLSVFLISVWAIIIIAIAAVEDTLRILRFEDGMVYLCGLAGVCALDYIVFSLFTLYYIGYIILAGYIFFSCWRYYQCFGSKYFCGNCGARLKRKGICPHCGALNK